MTTTVRLGYETGNTTINESARAGVFARLVGITRPILAHYTSDLYHDARWIAEHVTGDDFTFYYGVRETGTSIGTDESDVSSHNLAIYRVRVWVADGNTMVSVGSTLPE